MSSSEKNDCSDNDSLIEITTVELSEKLTVSTCKGDSDEDSLHSHPDWVEEAFERKIERYPSTDSLFNHSKILDPLDLPDKKARPVESESSLMFELQQPDWVKEALDRQYQSTSSLFNQSNIINPLESSSPSFEKERKSPAPASTEQSEASSVQ